MADQKLILIVDDDRELVEGVRAVLEQRGFRVIQAHDGHQGKQAIYNQKPDLVILELVMPRMGGYPVLEHFRDKSDAPHFIVITANEGSRPKAYAEYLGVADYIRKPFAMERLLAAVDQALRPVSSEQRPSQPVAPDRPAVPSPRPAVGGLSGDPIRPPSSDTAMSKPAADVSGTDGSAPDGLLPIDDPRVQAARELAATQFAHYGTYHAHKESMAYAGFALYVAAAGTVISAGEWPPPGWGRNAGAVALTAIAVLTLLWVIVWAYLHFALSRRRWGALRMAGCEMALVWLATRQRVDPAELEPVEYGEVKADAPAPPRPSGWRSYPALVLGAVAKLLSYPLTDRMEAVEDRPGRKVYPRFLMRAWKNQERVGTGAVRHERLIFTAGWGVYVATLVRTASGAGWI